MKNIIKFLSKFANLFIGSAVVLSIASVVFFYTFPFNVAEFKKINISNNVEAGGLIEYKLDFCRYVQKGTDIEVKRFIIPKDKTLTNPIELSSNPTLETLDGIIGCRTSEPVKLLTQISTPQGEYKLLIRAEYCIDFLFMHRCIDVEKDSDYFNIGQPSIPNRLSVINEELSNINQYFADNPEVTKSLGSVQQQSVPQNPTPPNTQNQPAPQQATPVNPQTPQPQAQRGIINPILDVTRNTVDGLFNLIGGK